MATDPATVSEESKKLEELTKVEIAEQDDIVTPWDVASNSVKGVDYDKLICRFLKTNLNSNRFYQFIEF